MTGDDSKPEKGQNLVRSAFLVSLGYAAYTVIRSDEFDLKHPLAGFSIALFLGLWQLFDLVSRSSRASENAQDKAEQSISLLRDIEVRSTPLRFSQSRSFPEFVRLITHLLQSSTTYYNNTRVFHHSGYITEEDAYFKLYRSRALGNTISMRRLVRLGSPMALAQALSLLENLKQTNRFEMRVWTGPLGLTDFEMMLSDQGLVLSFANEAGEPDYCVRIDDMELAKRMNDFFITKMWESSDAIVIKGPDPLDGEAWTQARAKLQELAAAASKSQ